jgi:hypothetical protein
VPKEEEENLSIAAFDGFFLPQISPDEMVQSAA